MHDGGVVVGSVQALNGLLAEVVGRLRVDVLPVDPDKAVAVRSWSDRAGSLWRFFGETPCCSMLGSLNIFLISTKHKVPRG